MSTRTDTLKGLNLHWSKLAQKKEKQIIVLTHARKYQNIQQNAQSIAGTQ